MLGEVAYTLDIRPTFIDELDRAVAYIERKFRNPIAADNLIADVYAAIDERLLRRNPTNLVIVRRMSLSRIIALTYGTILCITL